MNSMLLTWLYYSVDWTLGGVNTWYISFKASCLAVLVPSLTARCHHRWLSKVVFMATFGISFIPILTEMIYDLSLESYMLAMHTASCHHLQREDERVTTNKSTGYWTAANTDHEFRVALMAIQLLLLLTFSIMFIYFLRPNWYTNICISLTDSPTTIQCKNIWHDEGGNYTCSFFNCCKCTMSDIWANMAFVNSLVPIWYPNIFNYNSDR